MVTRGHLPAKTRKSVNLSTSLGVKGIRRIRTSSRTSATIGGIMGDYLEKTVTVRLMMGSHARSGRGGSTNGAKDHGAEALKRRNDIATPGDGKIGLGHLRVADGLGPLERRRAGIAIGRP